MSYGIPAAEPSAQVPVCPRHPDRPAYVRCQRCGRPACPDCQRAAAVGFQCVDCVNETKRTTPAARTVYGGAVATGQPAGHVPDHRAVRPGLRTAMAGPRTTGSTRTLRLRLRQPAFGVFEPWRMLTSAFLHSQGFILHIVLNMYMLWIFGQALEPLLGRIRFLAVYLLSAIGGSVGYLLLTPDRSRWAGPVGVVGASGADFRALRRHARGAAPPRRRHQAALGADCHQRRHRLHGARRSPGRPTLAAWSPGALCAAVHRLLLPAARGRACCRPAAWCWSWPC